MTVTPDNWMSIPAEKLKQMIAASAEFQTATGAANQAEALAFVHLVDYTPEEADFTRPFAIVSRNEDDQLNSSGNAMSAAGVLAIIVENDIATEYLPADKAAEAEAAFTNYLGALTREIQDLSYQAGQLIIRNISIATGPTRIESNGDEPDVYSAEIHVAYGLE